MFVMHEPGDVLGQLIGWGEQQPDVRAILLTSTRAVPGAELDIFSDYDVVLVVGDIRPFYDDRSWLEAFGEVLVAYWDPILADAPGIQRTGNVTHYSDGLRIDFSIWPVALLQNIAVASELQVELDAGYSVLLDKDGVTGALSAPTYRGYVPARPSEDQFQTLVNDFFTDAPSAAKFLWRDELLPAKWCLDYDMKHVYLRPMLEWLIERDHGWTLPAGNLGRGLKRRLPPEYWAELERCYAGAAIADNWEALFRTMSLFGRVASEVAAELGYNYPLDLERRVAAFVRRMQATPKGFTKHTPGTEPL